jgi:hypothetical protein
MAETQYIEEVAKRDLTPAEKVDRSARQLLKAQKVHTESEQRLIEAKKEWVENLRAFTSWLEEIEPNLPAQTDPKPNPHYPGGAVPGCAWE